MRVLRGLHIEAAVIPILGPCGLIGHVLKSVKESWMRFGNRAIFFLLLFSLEGSGTEDDRSNRGLSGKEVLQTLQLSHIEIQEQFIDFSRLDEPTYREQLAFGSILARSFDSVARHGNYPLNLQLPHYLNSLTFYWSAIDWKAPHQIRYSYFLEGRDADWSEPTLSARASYYLLPHGKYSLHIRAAGLWQSWSEPLVYHFTIRRPWWRSAPAYTLYLLVFGGASFAVLHLWLERKRQEAEIVRLLEAYKLTDYPKAFAMKNARQESSFLTLVQTTLRTHLSDENFGIAELCELLRISRTQLHRKLKSLTGLSTSHYIRSLRLEIASELLEETNMNVSEVAFKVGFSSAAYFSKVFKAQFGYAPSDRR